MKDIYSIIKRPIITEKSSSQKSAYNQYVFEVATFANKIQIKEAVEKIFKVKVLRVRTFNVLGKRTRLGRSSGKRERVRDVSRRSGAYVWTVMETPFSLK